MTTEYQPNLLNGVMVIKSNVPVVLINKEANTISTSNQTMTAIPYYAWAHRGKGEMMIWFPTRITDIDIISSE
jgi:hypothetical protein